MRPAPRSSPAPSRSRKRSPRLAASWSRRREEAIIVGSRILVLSPHPGQVKAELKAHAFDHAAQGGSEFQTLQQRIHTMLFAERIEMEKTGPHD